MPPSKPLKKQSGLTLIELIVVFGLTALLAGAILALTQTAFQGQRFALEQDQAVGEAREALFQILSELREMRQGDDGSYPLILAGPQEIIFYSDVDRDDTVERIRYYLDGTNLKKEITEPSGSPPRYPDAPTSVRILSTNIQNGAEPLLLYYNTDYPTDTVNNPLRAPIAMPAVTLTRVTLIINIDPRRPPDNFILSSLVHLRNTKKNF